MRKHYLKHLRKVGFGITYTSQTGSMATMYEEDGIVKAISYWSNIHYVSGLISGLIVGILIMILL